MDPNEIHRGIGIAVWRQIQRTLEQEIAQGRLRPGDRLPTEHELAAMFKVNRHTVRRALAELEEKGVLRVEQGRGTFVHEAILAYPLSRRTRFSANLKNAGREAGARLLSSCCVAADAAVATALGLDPGAAVVILETAGSADGRPIDNARQHFAAARFPDLVEVYGQAGTITATLRHYGVIDYERKWTRIQARMPSDAEADVLLLPRNRPVLITEALDVDSDDRPLLYGITCFASDRVQLVVES
ncbi:MAG: phosphonate metabolism transcriptional regulator PhnF [Azospirillaceae bacterium]|nr:phosphonate metabolism transcriptional regulator PhnF [Azospirillaceae bacterium]